MKTIHVAIIDEDSHKSAIIFMKEDNGQENMADITKRNNLKLKAEKDAATGLYNRIKLEEMLETKYKEIYFCGVFFIDLNDLKVKGKDEIAEEEAVRVATESICQLQSENVQVYRYIGDKLLVVACDYSKDEIRKLADVWLEKWDILKNDSKMKYSLAVGMAWDSAPVSVQELIARADADLYRNKKLMKAGVPLNFYIQGEISCSYGLHTRKQFFDMVDYRLKDEKNKCCFVAIDIEHFKLFNKWHGRKAGDEFLAAFAAALLKYENEYNGIASYLGGDNFAILLPNADTVLDFLVEDLSQIALKHGNTVGFLPGFGVYRIEDTSLRAVEMYDCAVEALSYVIGNFEKRVCYYNKEMTSKEEDELRVLTEARDAIKEGQYVIYLQPKCRIKDKRIVGGEALIRWKHPEKGMIPPGLFIPILEKNGFISDVDCYVWELVCKQIREWMDNGIEPVPISINVSRMDILSMNVVEVINNLVEKYNIDRKYIKIEITESAYVENGNKVIEAVRQLKESGFTLMMDDFGSGYSSLNMLKQIIVDIIKIDMKFLQIDQEDMKKGLGILKSVINMSNEIEIPIVVEGVETEEQSAFLGNMGVRFAQGYLFYRPMPAEEFTKLISDEQNVDRRGIYRKVIDISQMEKVLENMLLERQQRYDQIDIRKTRGGFFSYNAEGNQELLMVTQSVIAMYDCETEEEFREYVGNSFIGMVHPDDRHRINTEINEQVYDTKWQMDYIEYRIVTKKGQVRYINDYGHMEKDKETGKAYFWVFLLDVTDRIGEMKEK